MIQEPIQPVINARSGGRLGPRSNAIRIGLVVAACLILAITVVAVAASPAPNGLLAAAGASASPDASAASSSKPDDADKGPKDKGAKPFKGNNGNNGNNGLRGNASPGRGPITIRSIDGSQLSLATVDGWTRTIVVTSTTIITKGGQPIAVGDLKVGDEIRFGQKRNDDGTYTITAVAVATAKAGGEVTAVDGNSITIKAKGNTTRVVTVNGATVYKLGSADATKADVKVGLKISAQGTVDGTTFTAITVRIELQAVGGEVTAKTSDSITIKQRDGSSVVIHVTDKTTYYKGKSAATLTDIAVGDRVAAQGMKRADGSLDAVAVEGRAPKAQKPAKAPAASTNPGS